MTFDDGMISLYSIENVANPGKKPVGRLSHLEDFCFGFETLGINRYYTALEAKQQIEAVVHIPDWPEVRPDETAAIIADPEGSVEERQQYVIRMVQHAADEDGLRITRLSLERIKDRYVISS